MSDGGHLTRAMLGRALDGLWNAKPSLSQGYGYPLPPDHGAWTRAPGACAERLFAAEPARKDYGGPVGGPLQGPWPLTCQREPHPESPWHWDGKGTWWR